MLNRPPLEEYIEGTGKIRDLINKSRKHAALFKVKNMYGMLCSCLDTIGDTDRCLEAFIRHYNDLIERYWIRPRSKV